ncbi:MULTISPECIES: hypothetical protein [Rhizobium]|jgi:hypothetical protein|uniref:hypothetical protein n=1 Tax=Rhizobium TaxID=379 RepID=UPI00046263BD|nr:MULTISPECIES: hypothetical protein [Rhizobium]TBD37722.1 hypothetical protein ELH18_09825 [Rhizobium ruizarguesonis]TBD42430.1 hypothetical protein ELH19_09525 [Rhizobium ruizarguesonis]TBD58778.1 hypothetical protein ELH15_09585 [Rhizobium ruizarguesonis]TBD85063.1 hypothetical protein ELH13_09710 [Rhizobium ruizarguesonis]TBD89927.1 hypothetical protein ELH14_09950 [Rhizobium ruizarguesonis]
MMTVDDIVQVDPELAEDGRNVGFYAWGADGETIFWSISLPMVVNEDAFEDLLLEWRRLGWLLLMQQA